MAVVALKTAGITLLDAGTPLPVTDQGGRVRSIAGTIALASGDSIGSTYRIARVPSNARIEAIRLYCDAITTCAADIGLYETAANGGAVADVDAYATAQSLATAITAAPPNVAFEARGIEKVMNRVWQDAGATADTRRDYDLALTLTAAAGAAGDVSVIVHYVID